MYASEESNKKDNMDFSKPKDVYDNAVSRNQRKEMTYAEAALKPKPLEPPVTTATLPLTEKREGKSLS